VTDPRKILYIDIETSPSLVYTFQFWNVNISPDKIVKPGGMMCFAYSWDDGETQFVRGSSRAMAKKVYQLLDQADVVVTYNGNKFDIPHLQRHLTLNGYTSPSPFVSVDLFAVVKREQRGVWPSLRLGYLAQELDLRGKLQNDGFQLWIDCMAGDKAAWEQMRDYNLRDVDLLKEMFPLLRHKVRNLPSASLYMDTDERVCPNCGSTSFQSRGIQRNKTRAYRRFLCNECRSWFRGNTSISSAEVVSV
jgi:hypothetical protein